MFVLSLAKAAVLIETKKFEEAKEILVEVFPVQDYQLTKCAYLFLFLAKFTDFFIDSFPQMCFEGKWLQNRLRADKNESRSLLAVDIQGCQRGGLMHCPQFTDDMRQTLYFLPNQTTA